MVASNGIAARVVGAAAVERMAGGRYEWRDGGLRPLTGARKRHWEEQEGRTQQRRRLAGMDADA